MKTTGKSKKSQKGGNCGNYTITGEISPGIPIYGSFESRSCNQRGGSKVRKQLRSNKKGKSRNQSKKRKSKIDDKKIDIIINSLCKSIKRKCTPKYKKLLKTIVVNNM